MPEAAPNARVLSCESGETLGSRLGAYVSAASAEAAGPGLERSVLVVDVPGERANDVAAALRAAGAAATIEGERLVAVATREALEFALVTTDAPLAAELLRAFDADRHVPQRLRLREVALDLGERARVMAILNVTPDSFFDGGKFSGVDAARERAAQLVALGADILDIGGQSYSSANAPVTAEEEAARVIPVVRALVRDNLGVPLSIDTFRASVAEPALDAGAHLINDCSGLSDPALADVVARADGALVVMHLRGRLNVREAHYHYDDAMGEILAEVRGNCDRARAAGVAADALVVDPGLEFGKEPATDLEILGRFGDLRSLGYPILFAASRKSFIGAVFERPARELLVPSLTTAAVGIVAGARIVRVHDVKETVDVARMLAAIRPGGRTPAGSAPRKLAGLSSGL